MGTLPIRCVLWLFIYMLASLTNALVAAAGNPVDAYFSCLVASGATLAYALNGMASIAAGPRFPSQPPSTPKEPAEVPGQSPTSGGV